ncbi:hypothetical protein [Desulforegula conservatrix]|uniref:hypothetical protein n=1 Tax=Desulforegula conservatrix TaxID=153026 RepID=UPI0004295305|nr:hypothetical protein [Desulforegula conservatrix]
MTINGKVYESSRTEEIVLSGDPVVILSAPLKANNGIYPVGLLVTENADGVLVPLVKATGAALGTGNGSLTAFSGTLASFPVEPGSIGITAGAETFREVSPGVLAGSAGGSGKIGHIDGKWSITCAAAPANGVAITGGYITAIDGVLTETVDTALQASGNIVHFGQVRKDALKIGIANPAQPDAAMIKAMIRRRIYAR